MVPDDNDFLAEVESDKSHDIALTSFVDDHDVESRFPWVKVFDNAGEGHDPYGHCAAAIAHLLCRFGSQPGNANSRAFPNFSNRIEPADECLSLGERSSVGLESPRSIVDQVNRGQADLFRALFDRRLKVFE